MKLNMECVRDSLLELESKLDLDDPIYSEGLLKFKTCKKFGTDEFLYTLTKLDEAGFIQFNTQYADGSKYYIYNVSEITCNGHQYLDNVRDSKVWSETKKVISHFESVSVQLASNISSQVLTNLIKGYM